MKISMNLILSMMKITITGASGLISDNAVRIAIGQVLALITAAEELLAGKEPSGLPTYDDGLKEYLRATRQVIDPPK